MDAMKDKAISFMDVYDPESLSQHNSLNQGSSTNDVNRTNDSDPSNLTIICNNNSELRNDANRNNDSDPSNLTIVYNNFNEVTKSVSSRSPKKEKKVKSNKSQWRKEKGNKYLNKPYRNYKGVEVKSKEFEDYDCKCQMKCREVLSKNERKQEFQKFWELGSYEAQAIFLIARVDEQVTKKSTKKKKKKKKKVEEDNDSSESGDSQELDSGKDTNNKSKNAEKSKSDSSETGESPDNKKSKRQFSRTYILKSKQVCRNMFVKTLGITSKRINTALVKMRSRTLTDHRGLSQGGKNKISDKRYDEVVDHIKKMPRYKCSHLQGKFESEYLPPELSLSKMYDLYSKEVEAPVSLSMYKKIYYGKFNFKTKGLKKEVCNICKGEKKMKSAHLKKEQNREKSHYLCPSPPNEQVMLQQHQYRPPNFMPPPPINCNQSWISPHNFQMPQHNPSHYFEQPMSYE